jgi:hypothetical protein
MNTITTVKSKDKYCYTGTPATITTILVNGIEVVELKPIKKAVKEGYDSRVRFTVHNYKNELGLKYWYSGARSIKQVIEDLEYQLKNN